MFLKDGRTSIFTSGYLIFNDALQMAFRQPHDCPPPGQLDNHLDHMIYIDPTCLIRLSATPHHFPLLSSQPYHVYLVRKRENFTRYGTAPPSFLCVLFSLVQT